MLACLLYLTLAWPGQPGLARASQCVPTAQNPGNPCMASEEQIKLCSEAGSTMLPCPWDRPAGCRLPEPISASSLASHLPSEVVRGILGKGLVHMLGGGPGTGGPPEGGDKWALSTRNIGGRGQTRRGREDGEMVGKGLGGLGEGLGTDVFTFAK